MTWLTMNSGNDLVRRKCIKKSPFVYKGYCQLMCSISGTVRRAEINKNVFFSSWAKFFFSLLDGILFLFISTQKRSVEAPVSVILPMFQKQLHVLNSCTNSCVPEQLSSLPHTFPIRPRINRLIENKHLNPGTILR